MSLPRKARTGLYDTVDVNVFDISAKKIIFSGSQGDVANFLGVHQSMVIRYAQCKCRFRKKYALRIKSEKTLK